MVSHIGHTCLSCGHTVTSNEILLIPSIGMWQCNKCSIINDDWITHRTKEKSMGDCRDSDRVCPSEEVDEVAHKKHNVGASNYANFTIQPWDIWRVYNLNPWDADIVKRILRTKDVEGMTPTEARLLDYEKIKHICDERIAQLKGAYDDS